MVETLRKLKEGKSVEVPVYDFTTHNRANYTVSSLYCPLEYFSVAFSHAFGGI